MMLTRAISLCGTLLSAANAAHAQIPLAAPAAQALSAPDRKFIADAMAQGGLVARISQIALQRTQDEAVKQFAQKASDDQKTVTDQLSRLAAQRGIADPAKYPAADAAAKQLDTLKGSAFDKRYAQLVHGAEAGLVTLFHTQEHRGADKELDRLAGDALFTYEADSDKAQQLQSALEKGAHPAKGKPGGG
jgi:putative membrane protein